MHRGINYVLRPFQCIFGLYQYRKLPTDEIKHGNFTIYARGT